MVLSLPSYSEMRGKAVPRRSDDGRLRRLAAIRPRSQHSLGGGNRLPAEVGARATTPLEILQAELFQARNPPGQTIIGDRTYTFSLGPTALPAALVQVSYLRTDTDGSSVHFHALMLCVHCEGPAFTIMGETMEDAWDTDSELLARILWSFSLQDDVARADLTSAGNRKLLPYIYGIDPQPP